MAAKKFKRTPTGAASSDPSTAVGISYDPVTGVWTDPAPVGADQPPRLPPSGGPIPGTSWKSTGW